MKPHETTSWKSSDFAVDQRNSPPATTWGAKRFCSYRELVMEEEAKKWFAIMPDKGRLKEIRAAIADGL